MKEKLAMPCTQEQWEQEIKPRIEKIEGVKIQYVEDFDEYNYLVNNLCGDFGSVSNQIKLAIDCHERTLITYDPDRFCVSLGEEQPKWMPLTMGKEKVKEIIEIDKYVVYTLEKGGFPITCTSEGVAIYVNSGFNLIPYNPEIEAIKQQIAVKEKELEELKARLNK